MGFNGWCDVPPIFELGARSLVTRTRTMLTRNMALASIEKHTGPDRNHVDQLSSIQQLHNHHQSGKSQTSISSGRMWRANSYDAFWTFASSSAIVPAWASNLKAAHDRDRSLIFVTDDIRLRLAPECHIQVDFEHLAAISRPVWLRIGLLKWNR